MWGGEADVWERNLRGSQSPGVYPGVYVHATLDRRTHGAQYIPKYMPNRVTHGLFRCVRSFLLVRCASNVPWSSPPPPPVCCTLGTVHSLAVRWRGVQAELKARRLLNLFDASVQANRRSRGADQQHVDDDDDASCLTDQNRQLLDVSCFGDSCCRQ